MQKKKPTKRVYKPTKFGEGLRSGTAEWQSLQRNALKRQRDEEAAWETMLPGRQRNWNVQCGR
jgi:hypothetical protein